MGISSRWLTAGVVVSLIAAPLLSARAEGDDLEIVLRPYFWAAGMKGDVGVDKVQVPVDVDFRDYAGDLQGALLLQGEVRRGRWSILVDNVWMALEDDASTPGPFLSKVDVKMTTIIAAIAPAYRIIQSERVQADVLAGARYVYLDQELDLSPDFGAVEPIAAEVVDTTVDKVSGKVGSVVDDAKGEISDAVQGARGDAARRVAEAILEVRVPVGTPTAVREIEARGGGFDGGSTLAEERRLADAVKAAVAERASDLVAKLGPLDQRRPEVVAKAVERAASESIDRLKKNVSSASRRAIEQAETSLAARVEGGMQDAASADPSASKDWVDPFIGLRASFAVTDRLTLMAYGDIGGFGVGSDLTWQAFGGLNWAATETIGVEIGYRHLDIDYDQDDFVFDLGLGGFAAGVSFRL